MEETETIYKCPHCEVEIETLDYETSATEYGTYNIETCEWEYSETNSDSGDTTTRCPECGEDTRIDQLIKEEETIETAEIGQIREIEQKTEETPGTVVISEFSGFFIRKVLYFGETEDTIEDDPMLKGGNICPKCRHYFPKQGEVSQDLPTECPECGTQFKEGENRISLYEKTRTNKRIIKVVNRKKKKKNARTGKNKRI